MQILFEACYLDLLPQHNKQLNHSQEYLYIVFLLLDLFHKILLQPTVYNLIKSYNIPHQLVEH